MARSIEPWAASPYKQLGLLAEAEGEYADRDRSPEPGDRPRGRNWLLYYLRARVEHEAGERRGSRCRHAPKRSG